MKMNEISYYLGFDIGTDSVGYAVTDEAYSLLKYKGKAMWGVNLYDEAQLNTDRRGFRTSRRRLHRRQQRVAFLQEIMAHEIAKVDPRFYIRLQQSALYRDEAGEAFSIFNDEGFTDQDYHRQYPTIHHLICELMMSKEPHDVRLIYLACAWLVAHRGHFLSEVSKENLSSLTNFYAVFHRLTEYILLTDDSIVLPWNETSEEAFEAILQKKISVSRKYKELAAALFPNGKVPKQMDHFPYNVEVFLKALCGSVVKASDLLNNDEYSEIKSFSLGSEDDVLAEVMQGIGDHAELLLQMKAVYDWSVLVGVLNHYQTISQAKVAVYEQHKTDLALLKKLIRKYLPKRYDEVFRQSDSSNYLAYSYHSDGKTHSLPKKKANKQVFCDYIRKMFDKQAVEPEDQADYEDMMSRLTAYSFLPKQKDGDNRVIPYQLYWYELDCILNNAQAYLPFLREKENGITAAEKILSIFEFRIPYYVGPLNSKSPHAWVVRSNEKIYPWNFSKVVDQDASEKAFIDHMLNRCSYLPDCTVQPKESLQYQRYMVLNEINNLRVDGELISVEAKQLIYTELYQVQKKITRRRLLDFMLSRGIMRKDQTVSGIDEELHSSLKSYHDFRKLLSSGTLNKDQAEAIIEHITYTEDKIRLKKWLSQQYPQLSQKDIDYISHLNYKDFGKLSGCLLNELEGMDKETGELTTILAAMWNTNLNFMELMSDRFTFSEIIRREQMNYYADHALTLDERLTEMRISNAVKRPILRALEIAREVEKALGTPPKKVFVEVTRGGKEEQKGKRTKSRKEQILELYEKCDQEDIRLLRKQLEDMGERADNMLRGDALFLYYMQLGRCLYTGESIRLESLHSSVYDIDHIYPQSVVKDDSIHNNRVLVTKESNGQKSDTYPIDSAIRHKMYPFWSMLYDHGLMNDEKFRRLTRATPFSENERFGFINRQLTETSQSVKAVAELLKEYWPKTEVVYSKAQLASEFRKSFDLLKSRTFNDLHHAKDAYLNIVTGNVYHMRFSKEWFRIDQSYTVKASSLFSHPVICGGTTVWDGQNMLAKVKKTCALNNAHMTCYSFLRHGGLFDQMPLPAAPGLLPRKKNLPAEKYGGYNKPGVSFFLLVKYRVGKKKDIMVMSVQLIDSKDVLLSEENALEYAKKRIAVILGKKVDEVSLPLGLRPIKINTMLSLDGFRVVISGSASGGKTIIAQPFMPFSADQSIQTYMKRLEKLAEKAKENPGYLYDAVYDKVTVEENIALYRLYLDKLKNTVFAKRVNNPLKTLEEGFDRFKALSAVEQAIALIAIHGVFGRIAGGCDLTLIGGAAHAAATVNFSSNISNWAKNYHSVTIVDSSTSGLWESHSQNLLELL